MVSEETKLLRRNMFPEWERELYANREPDFPVFYYHKSVERIVLSHALFWVMTKNFKNKVAKEKYFLLLRQYQEEMLEAYLTEDDYFEEILHYCNVIMDSLGLIIHGAYDYANDKDVRKFTAICVVSTGFGGDMPDELADELLDDIDFYYNKVRCRKIEQLRPRLNELVAEELRYMNRPKSHSFS
ncbi:MAG: hypothetical protein ACI4UJ_12545 [Candidatus Cryptobacteroides sp.]